MAKHFVFTHKGFREKLINEKQTFSEVTTSASHEIIYKGLNLYLASSYIPTKFMYLFKQIRNDIYQNRDNFKGFDENCKGSDVTYFYRNCFPGKYTLSNVVELDLNKAYYNEAHQAGYLSDKYYERSVDAPKKVRLVLLGSIASLKIRTDYEGGKPVKIHDPETDPFLRTCWFNICRNVSDMLMNIIFTDQYLKERFLFLWVDAVFFTYHHEDPADVYEYFQKKVNEYGHAVKMVELDQIEVSGLYFKVKEKDQDSSKVFCIFK